MNPLTAIWKRVNERARVEAELDAEVRAYLDGVVEEKVARGMGRETAVREAWMEMGGREQVKEAVRDVRFGVWLENLGKDFVQGARLLRKSPGFTAVAVLTLALGIGPNLAIFSFVNGILLRPLPFPHSEQLVQVFHTNAKFTDGGDALPLSPATYMDLRVQAKTLQSLMAVATSTQVLTGGEPERVSSAGINGKFFDALGVQPMIGQGFTDADEQPGAAPKVILSYAVWQRRFGGRTNVVGETMQVSSRPYTIAGVMPQGFAFPEKTDIWLPLVFEPGEMKERFSLYVDVFGRLKPGTTLDQAQAEIALLTAQIMNQTGGEAKAFGARVASLHGETVRGVRPALLLLLAAVGLVLLIACVNVANLLLARGASRQRDLAVRAALGAGRTRLVQQLLSESLLLGFSGCALGLLLAGWSLGTLRGISPLDVPRLSDVGIDGWVAAFAVFLAFVTTLLFGLIPAWSTTRVDISDSLKEGGRGAAGAHGNRLRNGLVVSEVFLSLLLLVGAGLLLRTMWNLLSVNPGFDSHNVLTADVYLPRGKYGDDPSRGEFARNVLREISAISGVESASLASQLPLSGTGQTYGFLLQGESELAPQNRMPGTKGNPRAANLRFVSPDYFKTMRIPVLRGRGIAEQDRAGAAEVVVINQAMAEKFWPGEDPLGKQIRIARGRQPAWREIVGIVGNIRHESLTRPPAPEMYVAWDQQTLSVFRLAVRTAGEPGGWSTQVRQAVWAVDKDQPVTRLRPMGEVVLSSVSETRFFGILFGVFAALALLLASFGIYSVMGYMVLQRTREIGIRMALGARSIEVLRMVFGQGLRLAVLGVLLGTAAGLYATRWVAKLLFGVQPTDPVTFAGTAFVLLCAAAAACYWPARRATRVDPLIALRHE